MNNPLQIFALNMIMNNPMLRNNPNAQAWINVIQNGDSQKGEEIARNICAANGTTPEQSFQQIRQFFHI